MSYSTQENKDAIQELDTTVDAIISSWVAAHSTALVTMTMKVVLPEVAGTGLVDVATYFGKWDATNKEGQGWAKGMIAEMGKQSPPTRAERRAREKGN